ncbi:amidohydrolase [Nocardioides sp. Kera G14]|uniref:amidohydrolase n=1 Tax=Nocardioides sp. Kera G14 TaxID=2884264 RepID=UPI001D11E3AF|nr:amidohydrolase [Nocardioides sp. Kera G14]UDY23300.1 amidohydrolase family protein [Nocardioides sp. Kera G14]
MSIDVLLTGGVVHTLDAATPHADSIALTGDRIAWTGRYEDAPEAVRNATRVIPLKGRTVVPGFVDAHNHVRLGSDAACAQLAGASSMEEIGARLEAWRADNPDATWVEAEGYSYTGLADGAHPTAAQLDALVPDLPAVVFSYDVHTLWLNSAALTALGVDGAELPFGTAELDADGRPTGFVADFAVKGLSRAGLAGLAARGLPWADTGRQYGRLAASLDHAIACGITTVVEPQNSPDDLALFLRARTEQRLRSRLVLAMFHGPGTTEEDRREFSELARTYADDRLRVGPLKLYIDDVVEPHTAALHAPYANEPGHLGATYVPAEEFAELVTTLDADGFQLFVHATGDRGITTVLDAVARAQAVNGPRDARHQVVHVECLRTEDVGRFAELGVVACMQPRHASPEIAGPGHAWADAIGEQRWHQAWPLRSLAETGAVLALSSDWNVAEMEPLVGIQCAVTRAPLDGGEPWMPEEAIDVVTALRGYTVGSAYAVHADDDRGTLTPGKLADLVVLADDPVTCAPESLAKIDVLETWVGGECVYTAPTAP